MLLEFLFHYSIVDVVRVKSYVNRLFDPASVTMRITIKKLYFIPKRVVSSVVGVLWFQVIYYW